MLGAIVGDMVGSPFEFDERWVKTTRFELFTEESQHTDDTLMTLAVGHALMECGGDPDVADEKLIAAMQGFAGEFLLPRGGYGARFVHWLATPNPAPMDSWGNGSAMRVSAAGWLFPTLDETLDWAARTARVSHNHPEGVKGAQATAAAIFISRTFGSSSTTKNAMRDYISRQFDYDLTRSLDEIRPGYVGSESCMQTVPEAITAYLESTDFESALRLAVSLGGDTDTLAAITGSIAEAAYGVPDDIAAVAVSRLDPRLARVLLRFQLLVTELRKSGR